MFLWVLLKFSGWRISVLWLFTNLLKTSDLKAMKEIRD